MGVWVYGCVGVRATPTHPYTPTSTPSAGDRDEDQPMGRERGPGRPWGGGQAGAGERGVRLWWARQPGLPAAAGRSAGGPEALGRPEKEPDGVAGEAAGLFPGAAGQASERHRGGASEDVR